jgi:RNA-directed DNA polymerase
VNDIWFDSGSEGTPQGSIISPLLCNISLHGLENELGVKYTSNGYVSSKGRSLFRFADDLVILCHSKSDAEAALEELSSALKVRGLEVSTQKTKVVHILEGFDFLGYTFKLEAKENVSYSRCIAHNDPVNGVIKQDLMGIYVRPSKKSLTKVKRKLRDIAMKNSSNMTKVFIRKMNEVIRGYAQSKWHWHSAKSFARLDLYIYNLCWRWAYRRHRDKGTFWIKKNYFTSLEMANIKSNWVFYAKNNIKGADSYNETYLFKFHWFKIRSYFPVKIDKNPENKQDREYFKSLLVKRGMDRPFNILFRLDKDLADSQGHLCPICTENLYDGYNLNIHHITPRSEGGKFVFSNLVIIHYNCHKHIHSTGNLDFYKKFLWQYRLDHPRKKGSYDGV